MDSQKIHQRRKFFVLILFEGGFCVLAVNTRFCQILGDNKVFCTGGTCATIYFGPLFLHSPHFPPNLRQFRFQIPIRISIDDIYIEVTSW